MLRPSRALGLHTFVVALGALATAALHAGCSSSSASPAPSTSGAQEAAAPLPPLVGVYTATDDDGGADPLTATGDVVRYSGTRYSVHHVPCPSGTVYPDDAAVPDLSIADGCTSFGSFAISSDGASLSMTDDATGRTTAMPFEILATTGSDDGGGGLGVRGGLHTLGTGLDDGGPDAAGDGGDDGGDDATTSFGGSGDSGISLTGPQTSLTSGIVVSLYRLGTQVYKAVPCSGESSNLGADTGAMIRTATSTSFTCIQSKIAFPSFDVPTGPDGSYCTSFSQAGCTTANYYGRRGVPFLYYTFVATGRAECGFEYQPGLANGAGQGNPRWTPYIRDTAGAYVYGVNADQHSNTTATVWCGIESNGLVRMKINGSFINMAGAGGSATPLTSKLSFAGQQVHAFRVTGMAWPETAANKVTAAKASGTYFPPYTCQPMNQLGPVVYTDTEVCQGTSMVPSVTYSTASGGNARWTSEGDGYTLSPTSEVSETQSGTSDTDLIFPGGG